jgi:fatty-acyl-CoA synthase
MRGRVLFFDITFAPLVRKLAPQLKTVRTYSAIRSCAHARAQVGEMLCYES